MNVIINSDKLDSLAMGVYRVTGEEPPLTLDEMTEALQNTAIGSSGITPAGNINITQAGQTNVTNYATATVPTANFLTDVAERGFKTVNNQRFWTIKGMTEVDLSEGDIEGWISSGMYYGQERDYNAVPANTTITPSTSA